MKGPETFVEAVVVPEVEVRDKRGEETKVEVVVATETVVSPDCRVEYLGIKVSEEGEVITEVVL